MGTFLSLYKHWESANPNNKAASALHDHIQDQLHTLQSYIAPQLPLSTDVTQIACDLDTTSGANSWQDTKQVNLQAQADQIIETSCVNFEQAHWTKQLLVAFRLVSEYQALSKNFNNLSSNDIQFAEKLHYHCKLSLDSNLHHISLGNPALVEYLQSFSDLTEASYQNAQARASKLTAPPILRLV